MPKEDRAFRVMRLGRPSGPSEPKPSPPRSDARWRGAAPPARRAGVWPSKYWRFGWRAHMSGKPPLILRSRRAPSGKRHHHGVRARWPLEAAEDTGFTRADLTG